MNKIRHVIHEDREGNTVEVFALEDGMVIGSAHAGVSKFGEDPDKQETRCFVDQESAVAYAKGKCRTHFGRFDVDFIIERMGPGRPVLRPTMPRGRG